MNALILSFGVLPGRAIRIGAAVAFVVFGLVLVWRGAQS
jgi:hypothetical protein